jgi:hypothetical protein
MSPKGRVTERRRILAAATRRRAARIEAIRPLLKWRREVDEATIEKIMTRLRARVLKT